MGGVDTLVERAAGLGLDAKDIGLIIGMSAGQVEAAFGASLESGAAKANLRVSNALFQTAIDRKHRGHTTAAIYWTKARMGWSDGGYHRLQQGDELPVARAPATDAELVERFDNVISVLRGTG